ncbi:MAG TPA: hypothetical protein VFS23_15210, partial [Vicinamibacterales bacterium]|nr:hypothetical protein [Vicinamibacterales bacterium]
LAAYTWSRTRGLEGGYQDYTNIDAEIAPTATDRPHYFVGSGVYELPFGRNRPVGSNWAGLTNALLGGWSVSPILTAVSGSPLNVTVNGNPSNSSGTDRPNVVGDWQLDHPSANAWFNTAAFVANAPFTYGNAPRNLIRGPGSFNLDISIQKSFPISSGVSADVRFESFNVTNAVNYGNPNTVVGDVNFGRISTAGAARQSQIAVKLLF